jgi:multiple sugar transport system permease protein
MATPDARRGARRGVRRGAGRGAGRGHRTRLPYLLVLPATVLLLCFVVAPGGYALLLSLQHREVAGGLLASGSRTVFAGLGNYRAVLDDTELWHSVLRMLLVGAITVPATVLVALAFALLLDAPRVRLTRFTRLAIFLPYAVPGVIATLLWGFLYLPATSPLGGRHVDYFGSTTVFFSVANISVWGAVGFNMVVMFTALRGLPPEIYEAAHIDGASELQIALRVKAPLIRPAVAMCTLFTVLAALQLFNEPNTLQPLSNAISSSWVPLMKIYTDAFVDSDIHLAAATSIVFAVGILAISLGIGRFARSRSDAAGRFEG